MSSFTEERTQYRGPEIEDASASGYLTGFIGALLGAAVGVIPWILVAYFVEIYVGWLGFLVGWVSLWGYKLLHGVKKTGYATAVIYICSILCIALSNFLIYTYMLFTDPEAQELFYYAEAFGIPKLRIVWELFTMPEVLPNVLKDLVVAVVIGVLGLISTKSQINIYTGKVSAAGKRNIEAAAYPAEDDGFQLPMSFTVSEQPWVLAVGIVCTVFFGALLAFATALGITDDDPEMFLCAAVALLFFALGVYIIISYKLRRLEVNGGVMKYTNWLGKSTEVQVSDIGWITMSAATKLCVYDRGGQRLFKVEGNMKNYQLLTKYLSTRNIELRG